VKWRDLPLSDPPTYVEDVDTLVRQSTIGQLQFCGQRVALEGQEGFLAAVSEPMCFGTLTHYIISEDLVLGEGERLDMLANMVDWVEPILVEEYDWSLEQVPNVQDFFAEIAVAYTNWRINVHPLISNKKILAVEKQGELYLGEGKSSNIFLGGTGDLVLDDLIIDWKTANRDWKKGKADLSIQASVYMAMYKQVLDVNIRDFTFWVYDRSRVVWVPHATERTIPQIDSALQTAYNYGLQLEAGIYPATPVPEASFVKKRGWYCGVRYCGGWNLCTSKYLQDSVDESVIAERTW